VEFDSSNRYQKESVLVAKRSDRRSPDQVVVSKNHDR
jgi:hypothetical protein